MCNTHPCPDPTLVMPESDVVVPPIQLPVTAGNPPMMAGGDVSETGAMDGGMIG